MEDLELRRLFWEAQRHTGKETEEPEKETVEAEAVVSWIDVLALETERGQKPGDAAPRKAGKGKETDPPESVQKERSPAHTLLIFLARLSLDF